MPRWLWTGGRVEYHLAIPPAEAARRLGAAIKPDTVLRGFLPVVGLLGRVDGLRFRLTTRVPFVHNSFDSILEGEIVEAPGGSRLLATFRPRKIVLVFWVVWIGLATLFALPVTISTLLDPKRWTPGPPPVFFGLILPVFGILLLVLSRLLATWQERRLLAQLDAVFGGDPKGTQHPSQSA